MTMLKIENRVQVIPDVAYLRMLGASSSYGKSEKIGQFGSGFPNSLALLARTYLPDGRRMLDTLKICLGLDVYTFYTIEHTVKDSEGYTEVKQEICMKKQNGGVVNLNIDVNFGRVDWTDETMAVREFISNACDGAESFDNTYNTVKVEQIQGGGRLARAKDGYIRVYMEMTEDIEDYVSRIYDVFICLRGTYDPKRKIIPNRKGGPAHIYRKGVLVGMFGKSSLFHYNIEDISLKESRIVDSYEARDKAAQAIRDCTDESIIRLFVDKIVLNSKYEPYNPDLFEQSFHGSDLQPYMQSDIDRWSRVFMAVVGDSVFCDSDLTERMVKSKGHRVVRTHSNYGGLVRASRVRSAADVLNANELMGKIVRDSSNNAKDTLLRVWTYLQKYDMTLDKAMPPIKSFEQITLAEGAAEGYYQDGCVYVRTDIEEDRGDRLFQVILEECAHYITGAADYTRDLQEFCFKLATRALTH